MSPAGLEAALWVLGRGTGITALILLTLSLCLGITVRSRRRVAGLPAYGITALHRTASLTASGLIAIHVTTLLLDPQAGLRLVDLVVPFSSSYRPFWLGLGTLALELIALVVVSGLLRKCIGERAFRAVHLTSYALWPVALGHTLGTGTDVGTLWLNSIAGLCILAVLSCGWWRIGPDFGTPVRRDRPSGPTRLQHPEALGATELAGGEPLLGQPGRE